MQANNLQVPDSKKKEKWRRLRAKLRTKYRLVILNDETFEERFSFRLSRLNVFVSVGAGAILIITVTIFIIAFTPIREYIPGYTDVTLSRRVNMLLKKTDSLENVARQKSAYVENIRRVIEGDIDYNDTINLKENPDNRINEDVNYSRSVEDSLLREEYYNETSYDLYYNENQELSQVRAPRSGYLFFTPLKGIVTSGFDLAQQHYGIDIVSKKNEAVKATLDGTVIFAGWTIETGYTISIQHAGNFVSAYKHNAVLLKSQGNVVKAGDPIAIVGESGELSTGAHLHFELWYNGTPVDPMEYIAF
ncbi:MAG: M23 family metallopeptidase [Bacteroidales bacterium]|nr:M23 family metallopeptidase [Bacteroidales bacterium]